MNVRQMIHDIQLAEYIIPIPSLEFNLPLCGVNTAESQREGVK